MNRRGFPLRLPLPFPLLLLLLAALPAAGGVSAGEEVFAVTQAEIQALEKAISREAGGGQPDPRVYADLVRLKNRLLRMREASNELDRQRALAPLAADSAFAGARERLESAASQGGRAELRSLALFHLFMNEPEKAREQWRRMGRATDHDLSYLLISAYLGFALGEYGSVREELSAALSLMDARAGLEVSAPAFCSNIAGYRLFIPRRDGALLPGEDTLIYAEVEGAEFEAVPEGRACRLRFGLRLRDGEQRTLWAEANYGEYAPAFSGPVRDLHVALTWRVPNDLEPGRYRLLVEAVDGISSRRGENAVSFQVGKRETNPDRRLTALPPSPPATPGNAPGGGADNFPVPSELLRRGGGLGDDRVFELLQRYERGRKVD